MVKLSNSPVTFRRLGSHVVLSIVLFLGCGVVGCGPEPAPEIDQDVAAEIAAEDAQVIDAESEL